MSGIALLIDLLSKNPSFNSQAFQSCRSFSATLAASAAAASVASPLVSRSSFGVGRKVAYCDAGATLPEDAYALSGIRSPPKTIFEREQYNYSSKEYYIQLKPLLSAFHWKSFSLITLRSFLLHFLPLVEPRATIEEDEDDDDFLQDPPARRDVDLVVPFKKSVKQIIRETTVLTTRRILERLALCYVSQRTASKLIKDVSLSATRKAGRDLPITVYFFRVTRTTFRGHFLGVAATWLVQVAIDTYRVLSSIFRTEESDTIDKTEQFKRLQKRVYTITIRCGASLIFASIGAGIGATIIRPSIGQTIGCVLGDLAGPPIVAYCFDMVIRPGLTSP